MTQRFRRHRSHVRIPLGIILPLVVLSAVSVELSGQTVIVSNDFRYGIGEQYSADGVTAINKEYLENLFNSRIFIPAGNRGNLILGFRAQIDRPREFGVDTVGITQYFAEFRRDGLKARAGTFYNLVGRGLLFSTFESRPIGFNTQTEGVNLEYNTRTFKAGAYGGTIGYNDILDQSKTYDYLVRGAWGEVRPISEISLGSHYIAATGEPSRNGFLNEFDAYLREAWVEASVDDISAYFNWGDKRTALDSLSKLFTTSTQYGTGWYSRLTYTGSVFSVSGEYKDYRFDLVEPVERDNVSRATGALPFQKAPTLVPEHDKTLLGRNPHTIDFNDELGFQLSADLYPTHDLSITLLGTAASRHAAYEPYVVTDSNDVESLKYRLVGDDRLAFPELSDIRYSPYWEFYMSGQYFLNQDVTLNAAVQLKDNNNYLDRKAVNGSAKNEHQRTATGLVESTVNLDERNSVHGILEFQSVFDSKKKTAGNDSLGIESFDGYFSNALLTLEFTRSPRWSANARIEVSTLDTEQDGRQVWPVVGGTYKIGSAHTVGAQYGWERGGIVCTGGVCRFINPFTGFRLWVTSKL